MEKGRVWLQTLRAKGSPAAGKGSDAAGGSEAEGQSILVHRTGWDHQFGNIK